jgi:hypothetical protein
MGCQESRDGGGMMALYRDGLSLREIGELENLTHEAVRLSLIRFWKLTGENVIRPRGKKRPLTNLHCHHMSRPQPLNQ